MNLLIAEGGHEPDAPFNGLWGRAMLRPIVSEKRAGNAQDVALAALRITGAVGAVAFGAVAIGNEVCQRLVARGIIEWHTAFGYLSDLFVVPALSGLAVVMITRPDRTWVAWYYPACAAALYSVMELEGTWDPWDLVAYWVGAAIGYGMLVLGRSAWTRARVAAALSRYALLRNEIDNLY